jgi:hypothetical protein
VGVLDAANVLSSLANQSDPIGALIDHAGSLPELVEASERITHMIRQLHGTGTEGRLHHRALDRAAPARHRAGVRDAGARGPAERPA